MTDRDDQVDQARRRLLRMMVYTPPAVLSVVAVRKAKAQPPSCGPYGCNPNDPGSCGPPAGCPPNNPGPCGPPAGCPPNR